MTATQPTAGRSRGRRLPAPAGGGAGIPAEQLLELRCALVAGAAPSTALRAVAGDGPLRQVAREIALGRSLEALAPTVDTGVPTADLLVRALAVVERSGAGAAAAVDQAITAVRNEVALRRLLQVRTAQARGTAVVLSGLPVAAWVLLVGVDRAALAFYTTPLGLLSALAGATLTLLSWWCMRRLTARAGRAADEADPLAPAHGQALPWASLALAAGPAAVAGWLLAGLALAVGFGGAAAAVILARARRDAAPDLRRGEHDPRAHAGSGGGGRPASRVIAGGGGRSAARLRAGGGAPAAAEAIELVAIALAAGLPTGSALATVAVVGPPPATGALDAATRRMRAGWAVDAAFEGSGLQRLGTVLAAAERWGAPVREALGSLAADVRAERRAAAEEATERLQLALVFPTTLLMLPGFVLLIVPPLLWTALRGLGDVGLS